MPNTNVNSRTLKLTKMALMVAVTFVCLFMRFPIFPPASFLLFEVSDIPILIAGFVFGPIIGFGIGVVAILLHAFLIVMPSGAYGVIMHIIAVGTYVLVSGLIYNIFKGKTWVFVCPAHPETVCEVYQKNKAKQWGLLALIIGGLCMTAIMIPANLIVTPQFMGAPLEAVKAMILPIILPFNLLKMALNTVVVFILYKRISPFLHKW